MLGLGISMWDQSPVTLVGGGAWIPSTPATALAYYIDASDISTLFKNTAGTTPVTADGDQVLCAKDKSGNVYTFTQTNGSINEPIYRAGTAGDGKPYLELTGSNSQWLVSPGNIQAVNATDGSHSAGAAVVFTNNTGTQQVVDSSGVTDVAQFIRNNAGVSETIAYTGANADQGPSITAGASTRLIEVTTPSPTNTQEIFVNNTTNGSSPITASLATAASPVGLGATVTGGNPMTGKLYAAVGYRGAITSTDRGNLDTWLASKMP